MAIATVVVLGTLILSSDEGGGPPAPPEVVSAEEYQRALTKLDAEARPWVDQLAAATTEADLRLAKLRLGDLLGDHLVKLRNLAPPRVIEREHQKLQEGLSLLSLSLILPNSGPASTTAGTGCAVAAAVPVAEKVREIVTGLADRGSPLHQAIAALGAKQFKVGGFLPAAPPPLPVPAVSRPPHGEIVERSGPVGRGSLRITNGTSGDVAISVVTGEPSKPQVMVYVHGNSSTTVTGISGDYRVYVKIGSGWDAAGRRFTSGCLFEKFAQTFDQRSNWTIDLRKSALGNARTEPVPAF
ncbi:hypothetical protein BS329_17385 [Amycolatopsis coloradensis]|uniref:Uncharacterized protein n=1 Tax=Amycolatopsis coloradensis TaxID=76021 RepID=A0A1R0KSU7_9PSEU|nr:hypothetical protein BS329_17385 [Amycolatopsis coloradensis]